MQLVSRNEPISVSGSPTIEREESIDSTQLWDKIKKKVRYLVYISVTAVFSALCFFVTTIVQNATKKYSTNVVLTNATK